MNMPYELWWTFGTLAWVAVFLAARLIRLHTRTKERVAIRTMLHKERMLALERGVPLPEIPMEEVSLARQPDRRSIVMLAFLLIGIGGGVTAALYLVPNPELHDVWSLGLIPLILGAGCAVAAWMTRN
jgi:hypothetical protein